MKYEHIHKVKHPHTFTRYPSATLEPSDTGDDTR